VVTVLPLVQYGQDAAYVAIDANATTNATTITIAIICLDRYFLSLLHLYMNSPFSYKGKFIEGYTAITVLLSDMISKRLSRLIVASYYHSSLILYVFLHELIILLV